MLSLYTIICLLAIASAQLLSENDHKNLIGVTKLGNCRAKLDDGRIVDLGNIKSSL